MAMLLKLLFLVQAFWVVSVFGDDGFPITPAPTTPIPPPAFAKTTTSGNKPPPNGIPSPPVEPPPGPKEEVNPNPSSTPNWSPSTTEGFPEVPGALNDETPEDLFSVQCSQPATISEFCVLPEQLTAFLPGDATMDDLSRFLISEDILTNLTTRCKPGGWCLESETSEAQLQEKLNFWTNASDFSLLCWDDLALCLDYISDFYFDCDTYETTHLITAMYGLLCKMKEEPKASSDCIKQTIKTLHVSLADSRRTLEDLQNSDQGPVCDSRRGRLGRNFLCTTTMCEQYSALLYEFEPWTWVSESIEDLKTECSLESLECVTRADEAVMDDILSSVIKDEEKVYENNWILEKFDMRAVIVIAIISVAAMGAFSLVIFVIWRKRQMRVRVRDGMEYLEIKPEETEAFLENMEEIGDTTKLVAGN